MQNFKKSIKEHIEKSNVNVTAFERNAGLGRGLIQKILDNESKNPTIENVIKIADALNCSIDELFEREDFFKQYIKKRRSKLKYDKSLIRLVVTYISSYIEQQGLKNVDLGTFMYLVEEIYQYSSGSNNNKFDESFANYLLKNQL